MTQENKYYLREEVFVDPLVNNWYAWPNLIAPIPYAMYLAKTHTRLMKSFINNYELHIMANQDATLAGGGEFVDCSKDQVSQISALLEHYEQNLSAYYEVFEAIKTLDQLVKNHKSGMSIEPLYEQIPDVLKGYVELTLDLYHQPSYRLIEGLIYSGSLYDKSLQSVSLGVLKQGENRPFVLSTPRLADTSNLHIEAPFDAPIWDKLFSAREQAVSSDEIDKMFDGISLKGGLTPRDLFTTQGPKTAYQPLTQDVRVQYMGHAGLLVESSGFAALVDPVIANRTQENEDKTFSYSDLPEKIDYICLTHNHADHVNIETLLQLRYKTKKVLVPKNNGGSLADPSLKLILQQLGFIVDEVEDFEHIKCPQGQVISIPFLGEHGDLNIRSKTAWYFELNDKKIYAGADSSNLEPKMYQHIQHVVGDLDVLAIGMECVGAPYTWMYGALTTEPVSKAVKESRRLNGSDYTQATMMLETFRPKQMLIYALGMEPWYQYFMGMEYTDNSEQIVQSSKMLESCQSLSIPVERLCGKYSLDL